MERCDFCSVMQILSKYMNSANLYNQCELLSKIFSVYADESDGFTFDNALVCRWFKGLKPVSAQILRFYADPQNSDQLSATFDYSLFFYDVRYAKGGV